MTHLCREPRVIDPYKACRATRRRQLAEFEADLIERRARYEALFASRIPVEGRALTAREEGRARGDARRVRGLRGREEKLFVMRRNVRDDERLEAYLAVCQRGRAIPGSRAGIVDGVACCGWPLWGVRTLFSIEIAGDCCNSIINVDDCVNLDGLIFFDDDLIVSGVCREGRAGRLNSLACRGAVRGVLTLFSLDAAGDCCNSIVIIDDCVIIDDYCCL